MAASSGSEFFEINMEEAGELFEQRRSGLDATPEERAAAEEEGELMWAAVERLPSVKRHNFAVVRRDSRSFSRHGPAPPPFELVDVRRLDRAARERVLDKAFATNDQDNYNLLAGIKGRFDRYTTHPIWPCPKFPMTLLLGPPSSGKTTLHLALAVTLSF
ncbi:hypothetical protein BHE74_00032141, partial [Ensete ventricosum]